MITLAAFAVAGVLACQMDEPNRPDSSRQPARFNADSVQLLSACGKSFLVRNANDATVEVTWDVQGTPDSGRLILPARARGQPYSEVSLTTNALGTTRLFYRGDQIESNTSIGVTCVAGNSVPESAPDYFPAEVFGLTPVMHDPLVSGLRYHRGIITVMFVAGTSQVERQSVIAGVGAVVIGGIAYSSGEGEYILKLVADTSLDATQNARAILKSNPKVFDAGLSYVPSPLYRRPDDGPDWQSWKISSGGNASTNQTWALEDIGAPLAWGCETGAASTRVALIDEYFFALADLAPNLNSSGSKGVGAFPSHNDETAHGTRTMSLLAARGNNGIGMAGVSWNADVRAFDIRALGTVPDSTLVPGDMFVTNSMTQVVRAGAQIVSISLGELWPRLLTGYENPPIQPRADSAVAFTKRLMQRVINNLVAEGFDPLIVIAAGNREGLDASLSRFPAVASDAALRPRVIIVGGSTRQHTRWQDDAIFGSSIGSLVDIVAPAESVWSMQGDGAISAASGTSFSAPLVAGVAALLKSFDARPHMTAAELKRLILAGAVDSITEPNGAKRPILNAYGALKKAAERNGAPLCGSQRVWGNHGTGKIMVERVHGDTMSTDTLGTVDPSNMNAIFAKHGGKSVQISLTPNPSSLVWTPTGWINGTPPPNDGGVISQYLGGSHDGDSSVVIVQPASTFELRLWKPGDRIRDTLQSVYVPVLYSI